MPKQFNPKILIIGVGSIGKRHYKNLLALGYEQVYVYDSNSRKIQNSKFKIQNLGMGTLEKFDVAFICSPNHLHIKQAMLAAKAGCHLFIEKPLSHNLLGVAMLNKICQRKKLITMVGCNLRFHPCLRFIKNYLANKELGKIYSIYLEFGYYLPFWRPETDYRKNFAARRDTGGGIILDDIHEFDLAFWLNNFSPVRQSKFFYERVSNLEIETEDLSLAIFRFQNDIFASIHSDYLQQHYSRNCKVVGEKGNLEWDFHENVVWLKSKNRTKKLLHPKGFVFNQTYIDEIKYFFQCVSRREQTFNNLSIASQVLKYCVQRK